MNNTLTRIIYFYLSRIVLVIGILVWSGGSYAGEGGKEGDAVRGSQTWANNCGRCHNLRDPKEFRDDLWRGIVAHMRTRAMLTGQQTRDILAFLQSSNYIAVAAPSAGITAISSGLSGEQIFKQTCAVCHGADGKGVIPGTPVLKERLSKSDEILFQHIKDGFQSPGSTLAMPARGGNPNLTDVDLRAVLTYIKDQFSK